MTESGVVFLMYHELDSPGRTLSQTEPGYLRYIVRLPDFRAQMEWLKTAGWKGVHVSEAIQYFPEKTVALTFDDGCETDLLYSAPLLRQLQFSATFYITTGFLGKPGHLSPSQLRELSGIGFEIGCHSMTHAYLTDLDDQGLHFEVAEAKQKLEQILGKAVHHFSCPGGRHNQRVSDAALKAGYQSVATSRIQTNFGTSDRLALGRVAVMRTTPIADFQKLCYGQALWRRRMDFQLREAGKKVLGNAMYDRLRSAWLRGQS
jgi:peptidoglycan/xylan/chitin deacetylase (PgdA/CDA1 family)